MISDWQHKENVKRIASLATKGYVFNITADGYSVKYNGLFLGGASVKLPRAKRLHWRHARANLRDFIGQALLTVDQAVCQTA